MSEGAERVLGVGVGTFTVGFLILFTLVVWAISIPCEFPLKLVSRILSSLFLFVVFLVLYLAGQDNSAKDVSGSLSTKVSRYFGSLE